MRTLAAVAIVIFSAAVAHAETVTIAGIAVDYDPARWEVSTFRNTERGSMHARFACIAYACWPKSQAWVVAEPIDNDDASDAGTPEPQNRNISTRPLWEDGPHTYGGLTLTGTRTTDSTCRARTPTMFMAEGTHHTFRYRFGSGFALGCGGIEDVGEEAFAELLTGVKILP